MAKVIQLIDKPLYTLQDAARLSRIPQSTLRRWLLGNPRRGSQGERTVDPPVIRDDVNTNESVTWGEFIEAVYLRAYRTKQVALPRLRGAIQELRRERQTPYPLATRELLIAGSELYRRVVDEDEYEGSPGHQGTLKDAVERYLHSLEFEYDDDYVVRWRPLGKDTLVRIEYDFSFGQPVVDSGVRSEILYEAFQGRQSIETISKAYGVSSPEVEEAIRYENDLGTKQPAGAAA